MFYRLINDTTIAKQIALAINKYNALKTTYSSEDILICRNNYIVETLGNVFVGCVKIEKQSYNLSEIKHLVVIPKFRGIGLAKQLVEKARSMSETPITYAMVREDNTESKHVFCKTGFTQYEKYTTESRDILLYLSVCPKWRNKTRSSDCNVF